MNIHEPMPTIQAGAGARTSSSFDHGTCMVEIPKTAFQIVKPDTNKPPYRVPLMSEIREIPWNGFTVASTFSGCGGSSLGYKMAGFKVMWASEFIEAAQATYRANHPDTILDCRDIRAVKPEEVLNALGMKSGELDLLDGSPPCASFSTAGKREAGWGKVKKYSDKTQRTDDLFYEYVRLLKGIQPKVFVAENVSGLVKGTAKGYFLEILAALKASGYRVTCRVLDAQWLGVPQQRQRTIFIGVREDLNLEPAHPKPLAYRYSVLDALPWIIKADHDTSGIMSAGNITDKPLPTIMAGRAGTHFTEAVRDKRGAFGKEGSISNAPSPAIMAGTVGNLWMQGPTEKRKFTIDELKRICAFPDDFTLCGSYAQQWERLGNSVPPLMMKAIASTIRDEILLRIK
jgi:DNA (cytosine-5)-methyltransferase 1